MKYTTTASELTSIADAIRAKGGTSSSLVYPSGFISAISAIPAGGGDGDLAAILDRTISSFSNSNVTSIGQYAFYSCSSLMNASMPAATTISSYAFQFCTSLSDVYIPNVTSIGSYAFMSTGLVSIEVPAEISGFGLGNGAFGNCGSLQTVSMPNVHSISTYGVFSFCQNLTSVYMPELTFANSTCGSYFFYSCSGLQSIELQKLNRVADQMFQFCSSLATISIPSVSYVGTNAFGNCIRLESISLPECLKISGFAFSGCTIFRSIYAPKLSEICGNGIFYWCSSISEIYFPALVSASNQAFYYTSYLTTANLPVVEYIGRSVFASCTRLATATLGSVSYIGRSAFYYCSNLLSLYLPGSRVALLESAASQVFNYTPIMGYTSSTGGVYGSVFVPASLVDTYKSSRYWSDISSRITAIPE